MQMKTGVSDFRVKISRDFSHQLPKPPPTLVDFKKQSSTIWFGNTGIPREALENPKGFWDGFYHGWGISSNICVATRDMIPKIEWCNWILIIGDNMDKNKG